LSKQYQVAYLFGHCDRIDLVCFNDFKKNWSMTEKKQAQIVQPLTCLSIVWFPLSKIIVMQPLFGFSLFILT